MLKKEQSQNQKSKKYKPQYQSVANVPNLTTIINKIELFYYKKIYVEYIQKNNLENSPQFFHLKNHNSTEILHKLNLTKEDLLHQFADWNLELKKPEVLNLLTSIFRNEYKLKIMWDILVKNSMRFNYEKNYDTKQSNQFGGLIHLSEVQYINKHKSKEFFHQKKYNVIFRNEKQENDIYLVIQGQNIQKIFLYLLDNYMVDDEINFEGFGLTNELLEFIQNIV